MAIADKNKKPINYSLNINQIRNIFRLKIVPLSIVSNTCTCNRTLLTQMQRKDENQKHCHSKKKLVNNSALEIYLF